MLEDGGDEDDVGVESGLIQSGFVYDSSMDLNSVDGNNNMNDFEGCDNDLVQNNSDVEDDENESDDDSDSSSGSSDEDDSGGSSGSSSSEDMEDDEGKDTNSNSLVHSVVFICLFPQIL